MISLSTREITVLKIFTNNRVKPDDIASAACNDWQLSAAGVAEFFSKAERIASERTHDYAWFPCDYAGTLMIGGTVFTFEINAGLTGWLENQATTPRELVNYGCMQDCASLFPAEFRDSYDGNAG